MTNVSATLKELRVTSELLRELPELEAPRSFRLSEAPQRAPAPRPYTLAAGLATSMAALLLVALAVGDVLDVVSQSGAIEGDAAGQFTVEAPVAMPAARPAPALMESVAAALAAIPEATRPPLTLALAARDAVTPPSAAQDLDTRAQPAAAPAAAPAARAVAQAAAAAPEPTPARAIAAVAAAPPTPPLRVVAPAAAAPVARSETALSDAAAQPQVAVAKAAEPPVAARESAVGAPTPPVPPPEIQADPAAVVARIGQAQLDALRVRVSELESIPRTAGQAKSEQQLFEAEFLEVPLEVIQAEDAAIFERELEAAQPDTGLGLPLRQLEIALGAATAVLLAATLWLARRRRMRHPYAP